jgi:hypothetical protein
MKVNLIKDKTVNKELFTEVYNILTSINGPIEFFCDNDSLINFNEDEYFERNMESEKDFETKKNYNESELDLSCDTCGHKLIQVSENKWKCFNCGSSKNIHKYIEDKDTVTWETLFDKCNNYRLSNRISNNEFVIFLTEVNNHNNWFSCLDGNNPYNGFIHTKDWEYYINSNSVFPIAYEVVALIIQKHIFKDFQEIEKYSHKVSIGCINDMCVEKREIILKLRTADICPECMKITKENLPLNIINQTLQILESLRKKMLFSQNFMQLSPLSKIIVDSNKNIYLPDFENIKINLNPLEKTLYILYLFHPEGIEISSICNFKDEMYNIYSHISNRGDIQEMKSKIDRMADVTTNSASEKISKIKEKFVTAIGSELAQNYYIKGANSEAKKIDIDRNLVDIHD